MGFAAQVEAGLPSKSWRAPGFREKHDRKDREVELKTDESGLASFFPTFVKQTASQAFGHDRNKNGQCSLLNKVKVKSENELCEFGDFILLTAASPGPRTGHALQPPGGAVKTHC